MRGLHFDSVVQFLAFSRNMSQQNIDIFDGVADQYAADKHLLGIQKAVAHPTVTEAKPLENPFWELFEAEDRLRARADRADRRWSPGRASWRPGPAGRARALPYTIVRPSHTYDDGWIPGCFGSSGYGLAGRMLQGLDIVVPGTESRCGRSPMRRILRWAS